MSAKRKSPERPVADVIIDWLLDSSTPSIRYLTLRQLQGWTDTDHDARDTRQEIMRSGPVPAILAHQAEAGNWSEERSYYTPKFVSTHWSMLLLTELAADGSDARLRRGAEYMLSATEDELGKVLSAESHGLSCFWGNLLRYALHCGFQDDPRVHHMVRYLVADGQDAGWRCGYNGDLACSWGCARALWGLAAIPPEQRSSRVQETIQRGIAWLLEDRRLIKADYPTSGRVHRLWSRLNFPLFYQADILFVLRLLAEFQALDHPDARPALEWLAGRRRRRGDWRGASPFRRRTWDSLADPQDINRWVTLHAATVLQEAGLAYP
jgi:hypothetical protein